MRPHLIPPEKEDQETPHAGGGDGWVSAGGIRSSPPGTPRRRSRHPPLVLPVSSKAPASTSKDDTPTPSPTGPPKTLGRRPSSSPSRAGDTAIKSRKCTVPDGSQDQTNEVVVVLPAASQSEPAAGERNPDCEGRGAIELLSLLSTPRQSSCSVPPGMPAQPHAVPSADLDLESTPIGRFPKQPQRQHEDEAKPEKQQEEETKDAAISRRSLLGADANMEEERDKGPLFSVADLIADLRAIVEFSTLGTTAAAAAFCHVPSELEMNDNCARLVSETVQILAVEDVGRRVRASSGALDGTASAQLAKMRREIGDLIRSASLAL